MIGLRVAGGAPCRTQVGACLTLGVAWFACKALVIGTRRALLIAEILVEDSVPVDHVTAGANFRLALDTSQAREAAREFQ